MILRICCFFVITLVIIQVRAGDHHTIKSSMSETDYVSAFQDTLARLSVDSDNEFFKIHCNSILEVIDSRIILTIQDSAFLTEIYHAFNNTSDPANAKMLSTYLERKRPFILSWESPTDGTVSFSWLMPPKDWDPEKTYPLFVNLHGYWSVASNPIEYLTYPYLTDPSSSTAFELGYLLSPWGRGNQWYKGLSETDIWECIDALEEIVSVNPARKYLSGMSMGGYGVWSIAYRSPNVWAAIGIYAGALNFGESNLVTLAVAEALKDVPAYFVCGKYDPLLEINHTAYNLLQSVHNRNIRFVTFYGEHECRDEEVRNMYFWMKGFVNEDWDITSFETQQMVKQQKSIINYPNPFEHNTTIHFTLTKPEFLQLEIYNSMGQLVKTLINNMMSSGDHQISWTPYNLPSGIYFVRLSTEEFTETLRIMYMD